MIFNTIGSAKSFIYAGDGHSDRVLVLSLDSEIYTKVHEGIISIPNSEENCNMYYVKLEK